MNDFKSFWKQNFADALPLGYMLRQHIGERWIRFHSLPNSKRYPDSPDDYATLLRRANALADNVFHRAEACWLVISRPDGESADIADIEARLAAPLARSYRWVDDLGGGDLVEWGTSAVPCVWRAGRFDPLLRRIGDGDAYGVIWVAQKSGAIFAPYDGGSDIFVADQAERQRLRREFSDWLSPRRDGL